MKDDLLTRRRLVQMGAIAAVGGLAGCSNPLGGTDSQSSHPQYAEWVADTTNNVEVSYSEKQTTTEVINFLTRMDQNAEQGNLSGTELFESDPLLGAPFLIPITLISASKPLLDAGLSALFPSTTENPAQDQPKTQNKSLESTAIGYGIAAGVYIVTGEFNTDEIHQTLRFIDPKKQQGRIPWNQVGSKHGFRIYQQNIPEQRARGPNGVIAVNDNFILVSEKQANINQLINTINGNDQLLIETNDSFKWVITNGAKGNISIAEYNPPREQTNSQQNNSTNDVISNSVGSAFGLDWGENKFEVTFAAVFKNTSGVKEARTVIESAFGSEGRNRSLEINPANAQVYGSATYSLSQFQ